jgi:1,4-dihydroxy-2-naphthoyl-CoA hydrolase
MRDSFDPSQLAHNVHDVLGIRTVSASADEVILEVDVTPDVHQPFGVLHGGVSALLAEGAASFGGSIAASPDHYVVGTELNCSHLRPVSEGVVRATATPIRLGRTVQVWHIDITDHRDRLICTARCSLQVLPISPTAK